MNCIDQIKNSFFSFLQNHFNITENDTQRCNFEINTDQDKQAFGDLNSNAAMVLAKHLKNNPRAIAQEITDNFTHKLVEKIEIAGPGFLNLFLTPEAFIQLAHNIFSQHEDFYKPALTPQKINVEFVSANPTGPLHFGHGRNGILGDSIAHVLKFLGHDVTREFYINDAGSQIQKLGNSLIIRYKQVLGDAIELPEDAYHGQYLVELAQELVDQHGPELLDKPNSFFEKFAQDKLLQQQKDVLNAYGIHFDVWFSEKALREKTQIQDYIDQLDQRGYIYKQDGATWFKTTEFGDDKDRVLQKSNGEYTYLAADVPYLLNKLNRGFDKLIMILGQDHHSFVTRLHALMQAFGYQSERLNVILYQLVHIIKDGQPLKLSKRAGRIVGLEDVIDLTSKDIARFFYLNKKADAELEFDLDLAVKKSNENPIFYMQYAYVRTNSIFKKAFEENQHLLNLSTVDCKEILNNEKLLIKKLCSLKELLVDINNNYQTHLLAYYSLELAALFHSYYNSTKAITPDDQAYSKNRLFIIKLIQQNLELCFRLMGISSPESM